MKIRGFILLTALTLSFFFLISCEGPNTSEQDGNANPSTIRSLSSGLITGKYPFGRESIPGYSESINQMLLGQYGLWTSAHVTSNGCPDPNTMLRVQKDATDGSYSTVSEGMGYGMLLAVYFDDPVRFDKLYKYVKYYRTKNKDGLMPWIIDGSGTVTNSYNATDGDQDIAVALVFASKRWGSPYYSTEASAYINTIYRTCITSEGYVKPGSAYGGANEMDPSYFSTAWYRIFADQTGDQRWFTVIEKCFEVSRKIHNRYPSGLIPDWCNSDGAAPTNPSGNRTHTHWYDASRYSWRMAIDYCWFGDTRAQIYSNYMTDFFRNNGGIKNVKDGYNLNGSVYGKYHNAAFVAPIAAGAMVHWDNSFAQEAYNETIALYTGGQNYTYFNNTLRLLSLLFMTGNFTNLSRSDTPYVPVESVVINKKTLELTSGSKETLTISLYPENATNKTTRWTSSNTNVATVSDGGQVTAGNPGQATISAITVDGPHDECLVTVKSGSGIQDGTYVFIGKQSRKCIDVSGVSMVNGALIHLWDYVGGNNQKWNITSLGNGEYSIISVHSGKSLDLPGGNLLNGVQLQQWSYWNGLPQRFRIISTGDGYYKIEVVCSGKVLDVSNFSTTNGAKIQQWDWLGGDNQKWELRKL
jgi:endo-1,4-beta-D-glucanase Y